MISWLTYGVFLITTLLAILAIVDKTWAKDRPDLANGLRWVLFVLILLMFVANVVKDVLVDSRDQKAQQKRQEEQEQLVKIIKDQSSQIKTLSQQLNDANLTISDTRTKLLDAQLSSEKISEAIQAYVYDRLSGSTNRFVGDLGIMLAHASDGWLPRNKQEFFSKRSVDLICRWLNADGAAQVIPDRPWYVRFNEVSKEYEAVLVNSLNAYASRLPPSLIRSASAVARSYLIRLPQMLVTIHQGASPRGFKHPPMICLGQFDKHMEIAFAQLSELVTHLAQAEKKFNLQSRMDDTLLLSGVRSGILGKSRLKQSEVDAYLKTQERPVTK